MWPSSSANVKRNRFSMETKMWSGLDEGGVCKGSDLASSCVTTGAACMKRASQQCEAKRCWTRFRKLRWLASDDT